MKIGVMTFHASYNCGSMLQAFALQQTLKRKYDANVEIIDYSNWHQRNMYNLFDIRPNKNAIIYDLKIMPYISIMQKLRADYKKFLKTQLILSPKRYTRWSQLPGVEKNYDMLIAGGDQVWNIRCRDHDDAYYLNFAKNIQKVAYSPSLGAQNILQYAENPNVYQNYLEEFDKLSVREGNGQKWLQELTGREIPIVADPTLLLTTEEWKNWLPLEQIKGDYIFNYAFYHDRPETNQAIFEISKRLNMPVYTIDYKSWCLYKLSKYGIQKYKNAGPVTMVSLMKNASLVLTQSFHGTLFAAMFGRPFWSYHAPQINNPNDDRATYLLKQLGLSERYVVIDELAKRDDILKKYNMELVNENIKRMRENAFDYIDSFMKK